MNKINELHCKKLLMSLRQIGALKKIKDAKFNKIYEDSLMEVHKDKNDD